MNWGRAVARLVASLGAVLALELAAGCNSGAEISSGTNAGKGTSSASAGSSNGAVSSSGAATSSGGGSSVAGSSVGASGGASSGGSSGGATSTGSSTGRLGSSTGPTLPPYQGFDSGPRFEPPIDPGCDPVDPFLFPDGGGCVPCLDDADCPPHLSCVLSPDENIFGCTPCHLDGDGGATGCAAGDVCDFYDLFIPACVPDCRIPNQGCAPATHCEPDSGVCQRGCEVVSDCEDAGAVCDTVTDPYEGVCRACFGDAGCAPGELCAFNTCHPNCVDAGTSCPPNSICNTATGSCGPGCVSDGDCGGTTPICDTALAQPLCGSCLQPSDCPSWEPGCAAQCSNCPLTCGGCNSDRDCPNGLSCLGETLCVCSSAAGCGGPPAPQACLGADSGSGICGCESAADCAAGSVCELRAPFERFGAIGACIPSCVGAPADYCASQLGAANPACNPATGFCVPCVQDSDCTANAAQPLLTPSCIPFPDGGPAVGFRQPFQVTGGGQCGCRDTSACDDGLTCANPSGPGGCVAPCTFSEGIDSCPGTFGENFCNTFTGLCQQCLDDRDCTGVDDSITGGFAAPLCSPAGNCVQCLDGSQCPADRPGCGLGVCGFCATVADCPPDAGFVCGFPAARDVSVQQCMLPCVAGDDAGLGSVSDAGPACPASLPFCVPLSGDAGATCAECRGIESADCSSKNTACCGTFCSGPNDSCFVD